MRTPLSSMIVRLPKELHTRLRREAQKQEISLNKLCVLLLRGKSSQGVNSSASTSFESEISKNKESVGISAIVKSLVETFSSYLEGIVLYGSVARGEETESSDIDLLVVLKDTLIIDRDIYSAWKAPKITDREISPLIVNLPSNEDGIRGIWLEVALDGIVLFDSDFMVSRFLSKVRNFIALGRVKRRLAYGQPYWIHEKEIVPSTIL